MLTTVYTLCQSNVADCCTNISNTAVESPISIVSVFSLVFTKVKVNRHVTFTGKTRLYNQMAGNWLSCIVRSTGEQRSRSSSLIWYCYLALGVVTFSNNSSAGFVSLNSYFQWRRQDLVPGGAHKLLGVYKRWLSKYSRCQTLYKSKYTEKNYIVVSWVGHVPQCHIAGNANAYFNHYNQSLCSSF